MLINLRNALMAGKRLPYDAEVEFLESTGTQWIDTGVILASTGFSYEATFSLSTTATGQVFGGRTVASYADYSSLSLFIVNGNFRFDYFGRSWPGPSVVADTIYDISHTYGRDVTKVNGASYRTLVTDGRQSGATVYVFAGHRPSVGSETPVSMKLYSLKFFQGSTLVRDYIPVRKGTVGYLYDRVSGKLFGNAGTGAFGYGNDLKYPIPAE